MWSGPSPTEKTFSITKFGCTSLSRQRPGRRTRAAEKSTSAIAPKKKELRHTATAKKRGISDRSLVLSVIHMTTVSMDEFGKFIKVDNHAAVEIGDSEKYSVAIHVVGLKFNKDFPEAARCGRIDPPKRWRLAAHLRRHQQCVCPAKVEAGR